MLVLEEVEGISFYSNSFVLLYLSWKMKWVFISVLVESVCVFDT